MIESLCEFSSFLKSHDVVSTCFALNENRDEGRKIKGRRQRERVREKVIYKKKKELSHHHRD